MKTGCARAQITDDTPVLADFLQNTGNPPEHWQTKQELKISIINKNKYRQNQSLAFRLLFPSMFSIVLFFCHYRFHLFLISLSHSFPTVGYFPLLSFYVLQTCPFLFLVTTLSFSVYPTCNLCLVQASVPFHVIYDFLDLMFLTSACFLLDPWWRLCTFAFTTAHLVLDSALSVDFVFCLTPD